MTTYHFSEVLVWPIGAGGAVKVARNQRVTVIDPATSNAPTGLAPALPQSDADGVLTFTTTDVGVVDISAGSVTKRIEAQEIIGTGAGGGGTTDAGVATQINTGSNTQTAGDKRWERGVSVKRYGAVGDGVTDDSTAFVNALAANAGRSVYVPPGVYKIASGTRLVMAGNFSALRGEGNLISQLKFTHANGGLDIGNGTDLTYESRLDRIGILGTNGVTTNVLRLRKVYEPYFDAARVEYSTTALVHLEDCGQLDAHRLTMSTAPAGFRITGPTPVAVTCILGNFYELDTVVKHESNFLGRLIINNSFAEACEAIITIAVASGGLSIGELVLDRVRVLSGQRLLKVDTAPSGINSQVVEFSRVYFDGPSSTAPLVDFTALNNASVFSMKMRDVTVINACTGAMVQVHASQAWYLFNVDIDRITGVTPDKWSAAPYGTGGTWPKPPMISSVGAPNGTVAAPAGTLYQQVDSVPATLWIKGAGIGNTGWQMLAMISTVGTFAPPPFTTAGRPAASSCPFSIIVDVDLNLPIYSNGSTWLRLDGSAI